MSELKKLVKDGLSAKDKRLRTEILVGYADDLYKDNNGISQLGELIIEPQHNKITLIGILYILQKTFGVKSDLELKTLNELLGIGLNGTPVDGAPDIVMGYDIGIGGCGASYADEKEVLDQENIVKNIIPFRIVDSEEELGDQKDKYWLKKQMEDGKYAYYLKTFEGKPEIHSLWKDAIDEESDGNEVSGNPAESSRTEGIESFVQHVLRISAQDLREYFELYESTGTKYARFNTIGLCGGIKGVLTDEERLGEEEMLNVQQFSILNFSNEMLHFDKDLAILYRVYIS